MNRLYKEFGSYLQTEDNKFYAINKVYIFKEGKIKVVTDYFLDDSGKNEFQFLGETKKKNKVDLNAKCNFVVKSQSQKSWDDTIRQDLYINGDLNNYIFKGIELNNFTKKNERLDIVFNINGEEIKHCIGWNNKESNKIKYEELKEVYKKLDSFNIDDKDYFQNIKKLENVYTKYLDTLKKEENYTTIDYEKMSLASGTTEEENRMMIENN